MPAPTALGVTRLGRVATADPAGTAADAANGNVVANTGATIIRVKNPGASAATVTFVTPGNVEGQDISDQAETVAAGATEWYAGFDPSVFGAQMKIISTDAGVLLTAFEP